MHTHTHTHTYSYTRIHTCTHAHTSHTHTARTVGTQAPVNCAGEDGREEFVVVQLQLEVAVTKQCGHHAKDIPKLRQQLGRFWFQLLGDKCNFVITVTVTVVN